MSALGQKQTYAVQKGMSALPPKADICSPLAHVRFGPETDTVHGLVVCSSWPCLWRTTITWRDAGGLGGGGASNSAGRNNMERSTTRGQASTALPSTGGNYSFVIAFIVITPSSRSAVNETLSPGFKVPNICAS